MKEYYLDANAHVPFCRKAKEFLLKNDDLGHPSAIHSSGRKAASKIEQSREKIAQLIGAKSPNQIIFTLGCTQAAEWALEIFLDIELNLNNNEDGFDRLLYSPLEHVAVRDAIEMQITNEHYRGKLKIENNKILIPTTGPYEIICIHSHNETGIINQLNKNKDSILFSDMSQSLGKIPMNVTDLDVDIAIFGAHKFGGPTSIGFMYLKDSQWWKSFGTGGRYLMDRAGTPDVLGIQMTVVALEEAIKTLPERSDKMQKFQKIVEKGLKERGARIIAENVERLPNTTFFNYPQFAVDKCLKMSEKGFYYGLGSACGSIATGISTSLKALGEKGEIYDYARISQWGEYDDKDALKFLETFDQV